MVQTHGFKSHEVPKQEMDAQFIWPSHLVLSSLANNLWEVCLRHYMLLIITPTCVYYLGREYCNITTHYRFKYGMVGGSILPTPEEKLHVLN